jgi:hypothetical protein
MTAFSVQFSGRRSSVCVDRLRSRQPGAKENEMSFISDLPQIDDSDHRSPEERRRERNRKIVFVAVIVVFGLLWIGTALLYNFEIQWS